MWLALVGREERGGWGCEGQLVWISVLRIRVSSGLVRGDGLCRVELRDGCERGFGNRVRR